MKSQTGRIEELVGKLESSADPESLATARELVQSVMELYSEGLERVVELLSRKGEAGRQILDELSRDELVGNLFAANGLHPVDLEQRVREALEKVRKRAGSHGSIDLIGVQEGVIRLRAPASLKSLAEEAMYEAAPDLTRLVIEEAPSPSSFVPLEKLGGFIAIATNAKGVHS